MKHILAIFFSTGMLMIVATGCKKQLDVSPIGTSIVESEYYNTVDQCNTSVKAAYRYIDHSSWWESLNWRYLSGEAASDNAWIGNTYQATHATYDAVAHYTIDAGNDRCEAHWVVLYKSIGRFNSMIAGVQGAPIDENSKTQFISELKFLRAWCYFDLVRNWGDVPLVLQIHPPNTHPGRTAKVEVYNAMVNDLTEATAALPQRSQYPAADRFRATKGAALTLLAKMYLYMEEWNKAEMAAKQVIDQGEYNLETSFGALWAYTYKNGVESIFEIQNGSSLNPDLPFSDFQKMLNSTADAGWGYYSATSDLENAYKSEGDSTRLQWTINRHNLPVSGDANTPKFDGRPFPAQNHSKSARYSRKHYVPKAQRPSNGRPAINDKILRFADVLLIHAEACAMQNKTAEALNSLKRVRDRVSLTTDMSVSGWNLINAVRKERRLELAFEGDRLYDIRRWKDQSGTPVINSIFGPNGSFVKYNTQTSTDPYEKGNNIEPQNKGASFNPATHSVWPIPNRQIIISEGAVEQNPNY
jgi:starch-binding outer membrane protein, SusD/RagB family